MSSATDKKKSVETPESVVQAQESSQKKQDVFSKHGNDELKTRVEMKKAEAAKAGETGKSSEKKGALDEALESEQEQTVEQQEVAKDAKQNGMTDEEAAMLAQAAAPKDQLQQEEVTPEEEEMVETAQEEEIIEAPVFPEPRALNNVAMRLQQLASQPSAVPALLDPKATSGKKASAILEFLAFRLDQETLQSIPKHTFEGLANEVLVMTEARAAMKNANPRVKAFGAFGELLWQSIVDQFEMDAVVSEEEGPKSNGGPASLIPVAFLLRSSASTGSAG